MLASGYIVRPLEAADFERGYLVLLSELTTVGHVSKDEFTEQLSKMPQDMYRHFVLTATSDPQRIIGAGSLILEHKFIHGCGVVGHIEDVVISAGERGKSLGRLIIFKLLEEAKLAGCYKVILDCDVRNEAFYEKCGMRRKEVQMVKYF